MRFIPGHVLYKSRVPHGVAVADQIAICANTTYVLESNSELLDQRLLPYLLITDKFRQFEKDNNRGSTNLFLNYSDIARFELDLPPIEQQLRMAEILWAMDATLCANIELELSLLEYRQSLLDSIAHEYSVSHALASLDSAIEHDRPICYGILMPGLGVDDGIPVVKVRDFPDGYIQEDNLLRTTPEIEAPYRRSRLKTSDLIISIRGTIGRIAEVPATLNGANITQDTARLSIAPKHNRGYVRALLESRFVKQQILSRITGLAVKGINIGELRKIQIPLPSRSKQDEIAEKLGAIANAQQAAKEKSRQQRDLMSVFTNSLLGGASR
jgi:type I restriction enzyme S subunit